MESEHFECPVCLVQFNRAENIPKIVSCGHTICSACLSSIFAAKKERMCPLDRKSLDAEITVEALPTNIILLQLLEAKPASEFEQCPIHKEPAKMVCIIDKCLVCKYCGPKYSETHKDHKLVHYNDVKQKVVSKKQSLLKQLKGLDDKPKDLQKKAIDSQKQLKLEIEQNYTNIQTLLMHKMKRILKQVDTFFTIEQSQLEDKMKNSDLKKEQIRKNLTLLNKNQTISNEVLEILEKEESQDSESSASDESESYEALLQETSKKVKHELTELEQYVVKSSETLRSIFLTEKSFNYTEENSPNLFFYQNKIEAKPTNIFLKDFHEAWKGDHERFENYQSSITQWLYPNFFGSRVNPHSSKLERHEAEIFLNDMTIAENLVQSYKLVLDYFGMKMANDATGDLERTGKWALRYPHVFLLDKGNHVLIRRVLAFLNNTGFRRYAIKLVDMLDKEIHGEVGGFQKFITHDKAFNKALFDRAPLKELAKLDLFGVFAQYGNHHGDAKKIEALEKNCFSVYPEGFTDSIFFSQKA